MNPRDQDRDYWYGTLPNDCLATQHERLPAGGSALCLGEGERNVVEGRLHTGAAIVTQALIRRPR